MSEENFDGVVDTANLQFQELLKFAEALNFTFNGKSFTRKPRNPLLKTVTQVGFNTMVAMFKKAPDTAKWTKAGKYSFYNIVKKNVAEVYLIPFYTEDVVKAYENREILKVKIQYQSGTVVRVMNHMVKFVTPEKAEEFEMVV